jgi:hypothetical protein
MMDAFILVLALGLPLSAIAAAMAYIITWEEYSHHFAEKEEVGPPAREAAVVTFMVFAILTVFVGLLFSSH